MAWYKTGSVSVQAGQTSVSAIGTKFATNTRVGDGFRAPDGEWYEITNVASETVLGIYPAYQGVTVSNSTDYMIAPLQGYNKESADRLRAITDSIRDFSADVAAADASAAAALVSQNAAKASETITTAAASTASTAATTASNAAISADADADRAEQARDDAMDAAATVTGNLMDMGPVNLSSGVYPAKPAVSSFWKVTAGGTATDAGETITYGVGDTLVFSKPMENFYKIDNTESVSSVAGKTGVVTLVKGDVGLGNVDNTSDLLKPASTLMKGTGLFTQTPGQPTSLNADEIGSTMVEQKSTISTTTNTPMTQWTQILGLTRDASNLAQLSLGIQADRMFFRRKSVGVFQPWLEVLMTTNTAISVTDLNAHRSAGFYQVSSTVAAAAGLPLNVGFTILHIPGTATNAHSQFANPFTSVAANQNRVWHRQMWNGAWSAWEEFLYTSAIVNNLESTDATKVLSAAQGKALYDLVNAVNATLVVYEYTATAGQTVFSGVDNNGLTLNYVQANAIVMYNEGVLQKTVDYATTSTTAVTLTTGAEVGALIRVYAFGSFAVANHYTKPESDAIITNLALKSASKADIVGTVSQTAGVPTGAIIENTLNGTTGERTIRWADGTQMSQRVISVSVAMTTAVGGMYSHAGDYFLPTNFDKPFVGVPHVHDNYAQSGWYGWSTTTTFQTATQWPGLKAISIANAGTVIITNRLTAWGRWF